MDERRSANTWGSDKETTRLRLKRPPTSVESYLDTLRAQGLTTTADELTSFAAISANVLDMVM